MADRYRPSFTTEGLFVQEAASVAAAYLATNDWAKVHVVTVADDFNGDRQTENFQKITQACASVGIKFTWEYDTTGTKHDRDITTDHG